MMRGVLPFLILATACAAVPAPDLGAPGPQSPYAALARLKTGRPVRLHRPDAERIDGPLVTVRPDSASVSTYRGVVAVDLASVDTVWVHRENSGRTVSRALLDGAAGGLVLLAFLYVASREHNGGYALPIEAVPAVMGPAVAAGATLGGLSAATAPEWLQAYPSLRWRRVP